MNRAYSLESEWKNNECSSSSVRSSRRINVMMSAFEQAYIHVRLFLSRNELHKVVFSYSSSSVLSINVLCASFSHLYLVVLKMLTNAIIKWEGEFGRRANVLIKLNESTRAHAHVLKTVREGDTKREIGRTKSKWNKRATIFVDEVNKSSNSLKE